MDLDFYNILVDGSIAEHPEAAEALMPVLGVIFAIFAVVAILQIVAMWKIFAKAGEAGWKSIIPIYNVIVLFKVIGLPALLVLAYLLVALPYVGWIVGLVLSILISYKLAKSFNYGIGMTIVLLFLGPIGYLVLGLGSSQYAGPGGNA